MRPFNGELGTSTALWPSWQLPRRWFVISGMMLPGEILMEFNRQVVKL